MNDIRQWLHDHGLAQLTDLFERELIDLDAARTLTDADLKELGLPLGQRSKLRAALQRLQTDAAASETQMSGTVRQAERRQLTILFCDLVNSTLLSQRLDPERLRDLMQAYQQACRQVIERYEGHVAQYLGDGLMVYFGWPQAHEDDAERAVRSALELVSSVSQINVPASESSESALNSRLQVRIGIATGAVVVGETGAGDASVPKLAVGETPNLAARLQGLAAANQIVIGASTQRLLGSTFALSDLGSHVLKGIVDSVRAFSVTGMAGREGRFAAARDVMALTPMIGREDELSILSRRWARARDGEGHTVLLCGEPGIGKSRITQAFRDRLRSEPHGILHFQCSPFHVNAALHPFIVQFERGAGFERQDSIDIKLDKMEQALAQGRLDVQAVAPLIAPLLSLPSERYPALVLTPQKQKERTLSALANHFVCLARNQPTVLLFEDAHWGDPSSRELLDLIVRQIEHSALLLLMTYRPEFSPPWSGQAQVTLLTLSRLSKREADALILRITGGMKIPVEVQEHILSKTDGVPLFVEEMTKAVLESGLLTVESDAYVLVGQLSLLDIPSTLQASLMARLDKLVAGKEVAQVGACIGREFSQELIEAVSEIPYTRLHAGLSELLDAGLIFQQGGAPKSIYMFKHALVRDAAYASLLHSRREAVHRQIATTLEERFPDLKSAEPAVIAQHHMQAGDHDTAMSYWKSAAQQATERYANAEAIQHFEQALKCQAMLLDGPDRLVRELEVHAEIGNIRLMSEGYGAPGQLETFRRLRLLSNELKGVMGIAWGRAVLSWFELLNANYRACDEVVAQLEDSKEVDADHEVQRQMGAYAGRANADFFTGRLPKAETTLRMAADYFSQQTRPARLTDAAWRHSGSVFPDFLSWALLFRGNFEQAAHARRKGIEMTSTPGTTPYSRVSMLTHWLCEYLWLRAPARAEPLAREVVALSEEHGLLFRKAEGQMVHGWAMVELGDVQRGLDTLQAGYDLFRGIGYRIATTLWLSLFTYAYQSAGRHSDARRCVEEAIQFSEETDETFLLAELRRLQGDLCLVPDAQDETRAQQHYLEAIEVARRQEAKLFELRATCSLARLWQSQGKQKEAAALLAPVYGWFTEGFETRDLEEAKVLLDQLGS